MFKGNWLKPAIFGLVIVLISLLIASFRVGSEIGETRGQAQSQAANYERHAEEEVRKTCLSGENADVAKCAYDIIKANADHQLTQQDIQAQRTMARFTAIMGVLSVLGFLLGCASIGVIFIP